MKALTLHQPWASLIADGHKTLETRSYPIKYRGWLAIHAAKNIPPYAKEFIVKEFILGDDVRPLSNMPVGVVVAVAKLQSVHRTEDMIKLGISEKERKYGNYDPKRFAWVLSSLITLPAPIPAFGKQGIWEWPYAVNECDNCDGCGWHEGGKTIMTSCSACAGSGVVVVKDQA